MERRELLTGNTFVVPSGGSIQAAINVASPGDTVQVSAGNYNEVISLNKNNLTVESVGGASNTTITGLGAPPALVNISANGDVFEGFTVDISSGAISHSELKAVRVMGSNNTVQNNIVIGAGNNPGDNYGILVASPAGANNNKFLANTIHDTQSGSFQDADVGLISGTADLSSIGHQFKTKSQAAGAFESNGKLPLVGGGSITVHTAADELKVKTK
jgi:hypothetical protein